MEVKKVCNSAERIALGEGEAASDSPEGVGTEVAGSSWNHSQTADVSAAVVEIAENPGA